MSDDTNSQNDRHISEKGERQRGVDRETFDALADYATASWALWSDSFPDNGCVEEDPAAVGDFLAAPEQRERMNPSVVFVGLNPAGDIPAPLYDFHGIGRSGIGGRNDRRLKRFIQDAELPSLSGGYMTDLTTIAEPDSSNVSMEDIEAEVFEEQLRVLDQDEYTIIAFGNDAFNALADYTSTTDADVTDGPVSLRAFDATLANRPVRVYRVYHYSYQYGGDIIAKLRTQLAYLAGRSTRCSEDGDGA